MPEVFLSRFPQSRNRRLFRTRVRFPIPKHLEVIFDDGLDFVFGPVSRHRLSASVCHDVVTGVVDEPWRVSASRAADHGLKSFSDLCSPLPTRFFRYCPQIPFQVMLPQTNYRPSHLAEQTMIFGVPLSVSGYFRFPEIRDLVFPGCEPVAVPKVAIHKTATLDFVKTTSGLPGNSLRCYET